MRLICWCFYEHWCSLQIVYCYSKTCDILYYLMLTLRLASLRIQVSTAKTRRIPPLFLFLKELYVLFSFGIRTAHDLHVFQIPSFVPYRILYNLKYTIRLLL